jgi:two-component system, cell cycle sensor histidine kinase and response regulator CckA
MRLRTKTSFVLVSIVVLLLGLSAAVSLNLLKESVDQAISSGLSGLSQTAASYIGKFLEDGLRDTRAVAFNLPRQALEDHDAERLRTYLQSMNQLYPNFDNGIFLLDANGTLWVDYPARSEKLGESFASREYFQDTLKAGQGIVARPYSSERTGEPVLTFTALLKDSSQRVAGVLGCSQRLLAPDALGGIHTRSIGKTGYVYVFDRSRMMILHPRAERVLQRDVTPGVNVMFDRAIEGFQGVGRTVDSQGTPMLISLSQVPGSDWIVAAQQPVAEAFASIAEVRHRLFLATVVGALAALLLGLVAARHLTTPLSRLQKMALHLSARFTRDSLQPLPHDGLYVRQWETFKGDEEVTDLYLTLRQFSEELSKSLDSLRALVKSWEDTFDAVPDMIFILDREQRIVRCNQTASQWLEVNPQEVLGQSCYKLVHGTDLPPDFCPHLESLSTRKLAQREVKVPGLNRVFDISTTPLLDEKGQAVGSVHVARDITGRKHTEEALRESELRYHTLFDSAQDAILLTDDQGLIRDCNPAGVRFFQSSPEELLGSPFLRSAGGNHPNSGAASQKGADLLRLARQGLPQRFEWRFPTPQGDLLDTEVSLSRIVIGGQTGLMALVRDIGKQKQVQQVITQERERLAALLDGSPLATILINDQEEVTLWNRSCETITLIPRDSVLGRPLDLSPILADASAPILGKLLLKLPVDEILQTYGQKGIHRYEFNPEAIQAKGIILVGGKRKAVNVIASRIRDAEGRLLGVIQCAQDITKEEQLQKQLLHAQKMESIGTLAGGMAHEFNNILAVIQGYTQLALMEIPARQPIHSYLQVIEGSCHRAANLVRNMLTFARADASKRIPLKVNQLLESVQQLLKQTLPPDISLDLDLARDLPFVLADANQLEQAIINLAVNAKDAMPHGGSIRLRSRRREDPPECLPKFTPDHQGPYVEVLVQDSGDGIAPEVLNRIFDPFFTTKAPGKGTGLGLSIVYSIIENHHGCILVESEADQGTGFHLYLPGMAEHAHISPETPLTRELSSGRGEAILVVDDEERLREMVGEILASKGYCVTLASQGREGLALFQEALRQGKSFDLVILDLAMPVMSGQECLKQLLELAPEAKALVMSGLMDPEDHEEVLTKAQGLLRKPFQLTNLLSEVKRILEG